MSMQGLLLNIVYRMKPILIKIIPAELLNRGKNAVIKRNYKNIKKMEKKSFIRDRHPDGINLIGPVHAETGLGQSCRLVAKAVKKSGCQLAVFHYVPVGEIRTNEKAADADFSKNCPYNINIIHINPSELNFAYAQLDKNIWDHRYNIGYFLWELEEFPDEWLDTLRPLNEIWTPSEFVSKSIQRKSEKPVYTVPYCLDGINVMSKRQNKLWQRLDYGLPEERFLFLLMFDGRSIVERKNPWAAIKAFQKAFPKGHRKAGLVIKASSLEEEERNRLYQLICGYDNIYYLQEIYERDKVDGLTECVDSVISLHRAEGFGLVLAEAMSMGKPVIATNWSANTEFMDIDSACMVDAKLIEIEKDYGPFKKGYRWADADIDQAASYMKRLLEDKQYYQQMAEAGRRHISEVLGGKSIYPRIQARIGRILENGNAG